MTRPMEHIIYEVGGDLIALSTADVRVLQFFDSFLQRARPHEWHGGRPIATILVETTPAQSRPDDAVYSDDRSVSVTRCGDVYVVRRHGRRPADVLRIVRRLLREVWLAHVRSPVLFLHASAVDDGTRLMVLVGDKRCGKTTLMLDAISSGRFAAVTNDVLVAYRVGAVMAFSTLPNFAKIRGDVADRFGSFLRHSSNVDPFNRNQFRTWSRTAGSDDPERSLFLTLRALRASRSLTLASQREVILADIGFAPSRSPVGYQIHGMDPARALDLAGRHQKPPAAMFGAILAPPTRTAESTTLMRELAASVCCATFRHHGSIDPLLRALDAR